MALNVDFLPRGKSLINTVVYSTVLKGFAVSKRIDKVMAVYKALASGLLQHTNLAK